MSDQHEAEIARGLRAGQAEAWRALYDANAERVWRLAARLMGPATADVADVVQETFLAAARSAGNYDASRGSLWVWLSGIVRNHVAMHFRRERRSARLKSVDGRLAAGREQIVRWLENRQSAPPEASATAELSSLVRAALAELSAPYETLLIARYFDGAGVEQIAAQENSSSTAVRSKLARARRAFRRAFAKTTTRSPDAAAGRTP
jgi:RNA polymerase sigma-70 factor (ECF subfamily)